jgi:hypothetical protein
MPEGGKRMVNGLAPHWAKLRKLMDENREKAKKQLVKQGGDQ